MDLNEKITANPEVVYREEYDDWSVLFNPDSAETYGLDPVSSFIWKKLDGKNSLNDILKALEEECEGGIPEDAPKHIEEFLASLKNNGLVGKE